MTIRASRVRGNAEAWLRLGLGFALNLCLLPIFRGLAKWSSYDRQYTVALLGIAAAAIALVSVIPLFWRGKPWQAPIAFVLLWLPVLVLWSALTTALGEK